MAAILVLAVPALAQTNPLPSRTEVLQIDSGSASNTGHGPQTVLALHVSQPGASWLRLSFSEVQLSGSVAAGTGSFLRITSLEDGHFQLLNAQTMAEWRDSSAYFNGDLLLIEVIAHPNTGPNRVVVDRATVGLLPPGAGREETQCGPEDNRLPSSDPRAARLLPIGCTGFIIDDACGCLVTAGHCSGGANVVQFNVPPSNPNGSTNQPPPSDQYSVDSSSKQSNGGQGVGNDWAYFGAFPNSTTGLTPLQAQGAAYTFAAPPAWNSSLEVRITGYGVDSGVRNQVQQTHVGPWQPYNAGSTTVSYRADTQGGSSGSPVIQEQSGIAMGVHTHGGCTVGGGQNNGTASVHPGLQNALANPEGVCFKLACPITATTAERNGSGINPLCLASVNRPVIGTNWTLEVTSPIVSDVIFTLVRCQQPATGPVLGIGELLLNPSSPVCFVSIAGLGPGGVSVHNIALPPEVGLAGFTGSVQGAIGAMDGLTQLCNAVDFTIGCQ